MDVGAYVRSRGQVWVCAAQVCEHMSSKAGSSGSGTSSGTSPCRAGGSVPAPALRPRHVCGRGIQQYPLPWVAGVSWCGLGLGLPSPSELSFVSSTTEASAFSFLPPQCLAQALEHCQSPWANVTGTHGGTNDLIRMMASPCPSSPGRK